MINIFSGIWIVESNFFTDQVFLFAGWLRHSYWPHWVQDGADDRLDLWRCVVFMVLP